MSLLQAVAKSPLRDSKPYPRRDEVRPVSHRHRFVLELSLAGHLPTKSFPVIEEIQNELGQVLKPGKPAKASIQELSGYSPAMIHRILSSDEVIGLKQQIMSYYDEEFSTLFPDVINAVREGLVSEEMKDRLSAAKLWLKAHGRSQPSAQGKGDTYNLTAEDLVVQILHQREAS